MGHWPSLTAKLDCSWPSLQQTVRGSRAWIQTFGHGCYVQTQHHAQSQDDQDSSNQLIRRIKLFNDTNRCWDQTSEDEDHQHLRDVLLDQTNYQFSHLFTHVLLQFECCKLTTLNNRSFNAASFCSFKDSSLLGLFSSSFFRL